MMRKLYYFIFLLILLISSFWLQAEYRFIPYENFFPLRSALIQLSGIISIILMSIVMVLALRLPLIEKLTHGLDKSYRLHKYLGIIAVVLAILHWLLAKIPKYLVKWDILERPEKGHGPFNTESLYTLIAPFRESAEQFGKYAFYALVVLAVISLLATIKYKNFKMTHRLMALCFLVIAFHSVILIKHAYWPYAITYIALTFIALGCGAALWSLFGRIGKRKQHAATIASSTYQQADKVLDLQLDVPTWQGHKSGQFAFVQFAGEEAHPFTIASSSYQKAKLSFLIKELGDFTTRLKSQISIGQQVTIEGPYGCFNFEHRAPQIWIAGGIGIAAFKGILEERKTKHSNQEIVLYYCTKTPNIKFIDALKVQAKQAKVTLEVINNEIDPLLTVEQINDEVDSIHAYQICFCGPSQFSHALKQDLKCLNYDLNNFHEELFEMR